MRFENCSDGVLKELLLMQIGEKYDKIVALAFLWSLPSPFGLEKRWLV